MNTATRSFAVGLAAALGLGLAIGLSPAASADDATGSTCSTAERSALRDEIASLHAKIQDLRLTPDEVLAAKAEHKKAIADLRAEYGLPGATLTDAQRTELKAKIAALKATEQKAKADRRATIDPLKAQILADRAKLQACAKA